MSETTETLDPDKYLIWSTVENAWCAKDDGYTSHPAEARAFTAELAVATCASTMRVTRTWPLLPVSLAHAMAMIINGNSH